MTPKQIFWLKLEEINDWALKTLEELRLLKEKTNDNLTSVNTVKIVSIQKNLQIPSRKGTSGVTSTM